jgi:pimeloyl-ACP methyl ester carboxylesterase
VAQLERGGITINYEVSGRVSAPTPLLLTHGYSSSSRMWDGNRSSLGADRRVVTWDIRGHGLSGSPDDPSFYSARASVDDMAAILDACDIDRAIVGGLSLGGYLSLAFYLDHPDRVEALMIFDAGPGFKKDSARQRWNSWAEARAAAFREDGLGALATSPEVSGGPHDPTGLARAALGILTQHDSRVIESLPMVLVPTLVLVGKDDRLFLAAADYMAAKIPNATKVVLPGAGHAANIDQPAAFQRAVNAFLHDNVSR